MKEALSVVSKLSRSGAALELCAARDCSQNCARTSWVPSWSGAVANPWVVVVVSAVVKKLGLLGTSRCRWWWAWVKPVWRGCRASGSDRHAVYCVWGGRLCDEAAGSPRRSWKGLSKLCIEHEVSVRAADGGGPVRRRSLGGGIVQVQCDVMVVSFRGEMSR